MSRSAQREQVPDRSRAAIRFHCVRPGIGQVDVLARRDGDVSGS